MKTYDSKAGSRFAAGFVITAFLFGLTGLTAFAGDNTPAGNNTANQRPAVSIPAAPRASGTKQAAVFPSDSTQLISPLSQPAAALRSVAQNAVSPETKRLETLRKSYLAALDLEINGDKKKNIPGMAGLIDGISKELNQREGFDLPWSDAIKSGLEQRLRAVISSINDALNLPADYAYAPETAGKAYAYMTTARGLIDDVIPSSLQAYQKVSRDRIGYLRTVLTNYTSYKNAMNIYRFQVASAAINNADDFYRLVDLRPAVTPEPVTVLIMPPLFPPDSVAQHIKDSKDLFAVMKGELDSLLRDAKGRQDKEGEKKIASLLRSVTSALNWAVSDITVIYGMNNKFRFSYSLSKPRKQPETPPEYAGVRTAMQNDVFDDHLNDLIAKETAEVKNLDKELAAFKKFMDTAAIQASDALRAQVYQYASDAVDNATTLASSLLPQSYSWPGGFPDLIKKLVDDSTILRDALNPENPAVPKALSDYRNYLIDVSSHKQTLVANHHTHLQALQIFKNNLAVTPPPPGENFRTYTRIPRGAVDAQQPSAVHFPPDSIMIYLTDAKALFTQGQTNVQPFRTTAAAELTRVTAVRNLRKSDVNAKQGDVNRAKKLLDLAEQGDNEEEKRRARAAWNTAKLALAAAESLLAGAEKRVRNAQEDVDRLRLTAAFLTGTLSKMTKHTSAITRARL